MTLHGVGYGLDEAEACLAEFKGFVAAIQSGNVPPAIERISIVERNRGRVQRLRQALDKYLEHADYAQRQKDGSYVLAAPNLTAVPAADRKKRTRATGTQTTAVQDKTPPIPPFTSETKPHT